MHTELLTVAGMKYQGEASEVALKTTDGQLAILPLHEPLIGVAVAGPVTIHPTKGEDQTFAIFGGLLEVTADGVRLLADEAEHANDLVQSEIEAALAEAQRLKSRAKSKHELHHAQALIDRHQVRLEVVRIRRRHHRHHGR